MSTKTYNYIFNGNPGSVDVTVDIGFCDIQADPDNLDNLIGNLNIQVTLSEALPFGLDVFFDVTLDYLSASSSSLNTYQIVRRLPTSVTSHSFSNTICYTEIADPYERQQFSYEFKNQPATQEAGVTLAATVQSITNASCNGQSNGQIIINATGGEPDYTFLWSDGGPNSPIRNSMAAGTYAVTVIDQNDDEVVLDNIVITQPSAIQLSTIVNPITCFGGNNGSIQASASGSTAPYTYSWSDGSSQQNRNNLSAGNYTLIVTDAIGCSRSFLINVPQPNPINIQVQRSGRNVINVVTGGTSPYSFLWSDGIITKDRTNLNEGTYTFTVTDANGCSVTILIVIQDFKFYFSKNPIWLSLQADELGTKENLSFVCEVFLEKNYLSDNFEKIYDSEQPSKVDGSTDFNMEQVLNSFLDSKVPAFGEMQPIQVTESFKRFYLQYFEKFGTPPEPAPESAQDTFYVLFGGLSDQEFAKQTYFESYLDNVRPFMTWMPQNMPIANDQHAYLHYVVTVPTFSSLTLRATVYYDDESNISEDLDTVINTQPFEVYRFPAGLQQLQLQNINPDKKIRKYSLQLFSGENAASEIRTYEVFTPKKHFKRLLFLNSLGGWDSVLCFGRGSKSLRTSEETINRDLPVGYKYEDREEQTVSKSGTLMGSLVIANLNGFQRKHLIDLAISEKVYEQTATGYLPVSVRFDFDPEDDFENLEEIGLEIKYPTIRRYTPEL